MAIAAIGGVPDLLQVARGPPAAAMMVSPGWACSWSRPMSCPWVRTASVSVTMSEISDSADVLNGASASRACARSACHCSLRVRTRCCHASDEVILLSSTASASSANARFASATIPTAPSRFASCGSTLMLAKRTSGFWNSECDAVAKSVSRAPTVRTRSASWRGRWSPAFPPSRCPRPATRLAAVPRPCPRGSATGMPAAAASDSSSRVAPE